MTLRTVLVVLLAVVCGAFTWLGVKAIMEHRSVAAEPEKDQVVAALVDIPRGAVITPEMLQTRSFPREAITPGMIRKDEDAVGRVALVPLPKGEFVLNSAVADRRVGRGWAAMIPKGMRAFTILTPSLAANVSGFIIPGNKVDVLLTVTNTGNEDATGGGSTTTLLQNVEIWAVGQRVEAPGDGKVDVREMQSVTLLVTPDQAAILDLGQNKGTLHLALRNPEDVASAETRPATLAGIRFRQEKPLEERVKAWLELAAKVAAATKPPEPPSAPMSAPPPATRIRTLRGVDEGGVLVQTPASPER